MSALRPLGLYPWLIRAIVPAGLIGTYCLHRSGAVTYVGRSDTDLRRRLIQHAEADRGDYFTYDIHLTPEHAYTMECSLFHNLKGATTNLIHPAAPTGATDRCVFCAGIARATVTQSPATAGVHPGSNV